MEQQIKWVDERKVAEITDIGVQTLRNDRHLGRGIPYTKKGRMVRYALADVIGFMERHKIKTE